MSMTSSAGTHGLWLLPDEQELHVASNTKS